MAMALPFAISSVLIPLIGVYVDKYGQRIKLLIISYIIGTFTFILFILNEPIAPLILLGVTYSIIAAVSWPSLSLIVPKELIVIKRSFII